MLSKPDTKEKKYYMHALTRAIYNEQICGAGLEVTRLRGRGQRGSLHHGYRVSVCDEERVWT